MVFPIIKPSIIISKTQEIIFDSVNGVCHKVPSGILKILNLIDGKRSDKDIFRELSLNYNIVKKDFNLVLSNLVKRQIIDIYQYPVTNIVNFRLPIQVVSIEITDRCNLNCRYCYGNFKSNNSVSIGFNEIAVLFKNLKRRGVKLLEITGGEPSIHPDFSKIISLACEYFEKVTIMTNGVHFNNESFNIFRQYKDKIGFSISLDGFSESSNSFQRQTPKTFQKSLNNIIRIKKEINPQYYRIVYMLTNENISEIDDFFESMLENDIRHLLISIPEQIEKGRTYHLPDGCNMSDRNSLSRKILEEKCTSLYHKYHNRVITIDNSFGPDGLKIISMLPSCGAGWRTLSFKANGDVLPCNMMDSHWVLGNFKEDPDLDFLSSNNSLYNYLTQLNLSAEDGNRKLCLNCKENNFCAKCITKIFIVNQKRVKQGLGVCPFIASNKLLDLIAHIIYK